MENDKYIEKELNENDSEQVSAGSRETDYEHMRPKIRPPVHKIIDEKPDPDSEDKCFI